MMSAMCEMAVRVIVYLAQHKELPISLSVLANETRSTATTLSDILQRLLLVDIVHTPNGVFGGYCLLRRP
jgi:DNA-binding IscR family transcriptional regulator